MTLLISVSINGYVTLLTKSSENEKSYTTLGKSLTRNNSDLRLFICNLSQP